MQFGFMARKSTTDAILEFLWEVVWWALRCLGVDEWIVSVIMESTFTPVLHTCTVME